MEGDEAVYYKHDKNGNLEGMVSTHVDDFNMAGNNDFISIVTEKIRAALDISKIEDRVFRFTGSHVEQKDDSIVISMNEYAKSIEEVKVR